MPEGADVSWRFAKRLANQLDGLSLAQRLPPPPLIEKRTK
jgi:hypothetical protein